MEQRQEYEATVSAFPTNPVEFDSDDRISFSTLDNKFLLVQEDGTEFEFDEAIKRWIPVLDEALLEVQQRAYMVSGVDESEPVETMKRKRKKEYVNGEDVSLLPLRIAELTPSRKVDEQPKPPRKPKHLSHPAKTPPSM
jgi:HIV Tat-specific factor 1